MQLLNQIKGVLLSNTAKNSALFTVFSFINSGFSFMLLLLLANYITPAEYGLLNLFTVFVTILTIFVNLGVSGYVGVVYFREEEDTYKSIITIVILISTCVFLVYSLAILIFPSYFEKVVGLELKYVLIAAAVCYFQVFNNQQLDILRIKEKVWWYGLLSVSNSGFNFLLSIILVISLSFGWEGRVYTIFILGVCYFLVAVIYLIRESQIEFCWPQKKVLRDCLAYSLPLLPHMTGVWIRQGSDRFIINMYHEQTEVGLFGFAATISAILIMIGTAFNAVNSVQIYKQLSGGYEKNKRSMDQIINYTGVLFVILAIAIIVISYIALPFVFPEYVGSFIYIIPLVLSAFFQCIYLLYVNYLFFYKKTLVLMYITVFFSIFQLIVSLVLTRYDVLYTGYINMLTSMMICLSVIFYKKKICNQVLQEELKTIPVQ